MFVLSKLLLKFKFPLSRRTWHPAQIRTPPKSCHVLLLPSPSLPPSTQHNTSASALRNPPWTLADPSRIGHQILIAPGEEGPGGHEEQIGQ